jgi:hypothetical protein
MRKLNTGSIVDVTLVALLLGGLVAVLILIGEAASAQEAPPPKGLEVMALEAGVWDADITFPSNQPGVPDRKAKGVQDNELRSGGLWMLNRFSVEGTPYEGTGVWGYDRVTGRYSGIWADNNDQQIRMDDGRWDPATRTMTWSANSADPQGRYTRYLFTEKFEGDIRRFDMVALTRKGVVPLVHMIFTKRSATAPAGIRKG